MLFYNKPRTVYKLWNIYDKALNTQQMFDRFLLLLKNIYRVVYFSSRILFLNERNKAFMKDWNENLVYLNSPQKCVEK